MCGEECGGDGGEISEVGKRLILEDRLVVL